ncbi:MAG TPA: hypothetical protein V6C86_06650 [Oculatellaceae cyanobacterium]
MSHQEFSKVRRPRCAAMRRGTVEGHLPDPHHVERLVETTLLLNEAVIKCDQILRYQQLIALRQAQEEEMTDEPVHPRRTVVRAAKEVHTA